MTDRKMTYNLSIDGYIGPWGYTDAYVRETLEACSGKPVDVKIASLGGDVGEALAMRRSFADHGDVTAHICGMTASAATIVALGAKRVLMDADALFLVHKCSSPVFLFDYFNADEMAEIISSIGKDKRDNETIDRVISTIYGKRTGKSVEDVLALMKEERWLTAQEALEFGFIDGIEEIGEGVEITDAVRTKVNAIGLTLKGLPQPAEAPIEKPKTLLGKLRRAIGIDDAQPAPEPVVFNLGDNLKVAFGRDTVVCTADNKVEITVPDLEGTERLLAELSSQVRQLNERCHDLDNQVANLKAAPADDTLNIEDGAEVQQTDGYSAAYNMYNSIRNIL